jgi:general secretion pathway protein C
LTGFLNKMASKRKSKKAILKIPPKTADRIVAISLQHSELGARRLVSVLKKKRIFVSAASIQSLLRREGLQNREKRLAKLNALSKKTRKLESHPKKTATKITDDVADRICEISLQNPERGASGLAPLLQKKGILASSSMVYRILKRCGLQTREKRMAKAAEISTQPVFFPKTFPKKIPPEVEERIVELSLQNPEYGARRLKPLLQQEEIFVSASTVYSILKRNNLGSRQKRLLNFQAQPVLVPPVGAEVGRPKPFVESMETEPIPVEGEKPQEIFEPAPAVPIPPKDESLAPADMLQPAVKPAVAFAGADRSPLRKAPVKPVIKRSDWVFYPLYLLLFVLIAYLGFHAVLAIRLARLETRTVAPADSAALGIYTKAESAASERPLDGYRQIWERNLFNIPQSKDSESPEKILLDKIVLAKRDLGLELVGTVVADDPRWSRAIIDNLKTREQEAYREGDKAGEVRIKKILRNNVVITTAEGDELLTVEIKETAKGPASYAPSQHVGSQSASAPEASGSARTPTRTLSLNLKRDEVASAVADIDGFIKQLTITPYKSGDQPSGFMIGSITPQNILRKMGLRSRDVITAINDEVITGPEQAADFFERLSRGGEVTINFQRRRRDREIRLNIE